MNPTNKLNTKSFIEKAKKIHGEKYDYSEVDYVNNHTLIGIICREHGLFFQLPMSHLRGNGCKECRKDTKESFIKKAIKKHGEKYDYSMVIYQGSKVKVLIRCKKHNKIFSQIPNAHLSSKYGGCPLCAKEINIAAQRMTQEEFIRRAIEIHGDKYDYSKVFYINKESLIEIGCRKHGIFKQRAGAHLRGQGCPFCRTFYKKSKKEQQVLEYIKTFYKKEIINNSFDIIYPLELDIFLPEINVAIEFNGTYWHKLKEELHPGSHKLKAKLCKEKNIKLINISEKSWTKECDKAKAKIKGIIEKQLI